MKRAYYYLPKGHDMNNPDPITSLGTEYGCHICSKKTDNFCFIEYYILPSKLVRKRHREKEQCILLCPYCFDNNDLLAVSGTGKSVVISKTEYHDMNNIECNICDVDMDLSQIHGIVSLLHMIGGSGIESRPLAFFCSDCLEQWGVGV